jgi:hypothetical protein
MTDEFEKVDDASQINQGDVFEWMDDNKTRPWRNYGIVVTADCDLEHKKTDGLVSFVPALIAEDYLWHFWKEKRLASTRKQLLSTLHIRTTKILAEQNPNHTGLSDGAFEFLLRQHGETLPSVIGLNEPGKIANFARELSKVLLFFLWIGRLIPTLSCWYPHTSS